MAEGKGLFSKLGNWSISHLFGMAALALVLPGVSDFVHEHVGDFGKWARGKLSGMFNLGSGATELAAGVTSGVPIKSMITGLPGVGEDLTPAV